ncbi:MAG: hypothetical protein CL678_13785 [Bdellovibrionaceae bacterium]|nr:hypothetical protein [Pseudobdellovibrionaceae bacterium]|tara:strand:- start:940 stop:1890 length:951 start_codon:yes stop_codon:yes gene_type:complete
MSPELSQSFDSANHLSYNPLSMKFIDVYQYTDPRKFLVDTLETRQDAQPGFSLRAWSKEMELKSHSLLVMLLHGKRPLRVKHGSFLVKGLKLSSQEKLYFQALLQFHSAQTPEEKTLCQTWLQQLTPTGKFKSKEIDEFHVISDWLYTFLLAATRLKNQKFDPASLSQRLGKKVSQIKIKAAIDRLLEMNLLTKNNSKFITTAQRVTTANDVAHKGAKTYHQKVSDLAKKAVESQPLTEREFQSCSLAIDPERIDLAKEMIRKFRNEFSKAMKNENSTEVYQLNLQFFRLTEGPFPKSSFTACADNLKNQKEKNND